MDEAHRDRLHTEFDERLHLLPGVVEIQGCDHLAVDADSFDHLQATRAFHQRLGFLPGHVVQLWNPQSSQFQHIGEPCRGQQTRESALSLQDGIGRHGAPMNHISGVGRLDAVGHDDLPDPIDHAFAEVPGRRQQLVGIDVPARAGDHHIGERPSHVNADSYLAGWPKAGSAHA